MYLDGANACPPEDVGGLGGYDEFLQAISNPADEQHDAMWRWWGGPFNPASFDQLSQPLDPPLCYPSASERLRPFVKM